MKVETLLLNDADGGVPNSPLPLVIYRRVLPAATTDAAAWFERHFAENDWPAQWRFGIYPYTHFHSDAHELLGVFAGQAKIQFGGENGPVIEIAYGDAVLIPAGVGHKAIDNSRDFEAVGAYPPGVSADLCRDEPEKLHQRQQRLAKVSVPAHDPITGDHGGITTLWHNPRQA
ncbi:cupin [Biostraticola tofi]|uniref:Uncharacterized protein YjlB n=1 Tax=Biostraticola tofi TaxID=466109 RepID=A0A4R3YSW9_9GAMM|nr:cupin [Biostraticola tofi]TCV95516.1 uncharacterized protein YjlB [Biostraticola tofi]